MIGVGFFDGSCQCVPRGSALVALDVAAYHPDDVGLVLVALSEELPVGRSLFLVHFLYLRPPDAVHGDVDAVGLRHVDDVVEVIPIAVVARLCVSCEVECCIVGRLAVDVEGGYGVEHLYLFDVVALLPLFVEEEFHFVAVEPFGQQPRRVPHPEEGLSVLVYEVALVVRHFQFAVFPRLVDGGGLSAGGDED